MAQELLRMAGTPEECLCGAGRLRGAGGPFCCFLPDWLEAEDAESQSPLRFLRASFRREYHLTHRVSWAASWVWGSSGEKVGDILGGRGRGRPHRPDSVASFLLESWISAGRAKLTVSEIPGEYLHPPGPMRGRCGTPSARCGWTRWRLPAFRLARGKAAALIESGKVQVNWRGVYETGSSSGGGGHRVRPGIWKI